MSGGTVLITGSSGFIGRKLAAKLAGNHQVVGLDREKIPVRYIRIGGHGSHL